MTPLSSLCFKIAVLLFIAGICIGIGMGISQDHALYSAHAHLNLLGWVSVAIFGTYYQFNPAKAAMRIARLQIGLHVAGALVLFVGLSALAYGMSGVEPVLALASIVILAGALIFGFIVFLPTKSV